MDFGSRLATARKNKGLSQEELAELLGVSRQTIYKWETGITYPDIDKLCDISRRLEVTTVYLLDGEEPSQSQEAAPVIQEAAPISKEETVKHFAVFSKTVGFSTLLILLGVALLVGLSVFDTFVMTAIGVVVLLTSIFAAVLGYVTSGIKHEGFKKDTVGRIVFDKVEKQKETRSFTFKIALGLVLIFIGIIAVVICGLLESDILATVAVACMLALIGVACYFFITAGVMHELYNAPEKALMTEEEEKKKKSSLEEAISGIIMAIATATFLVLGFVFDLWHPGWVAFPIAAIISGCISSIIKITRGGSDETDDD